MQKTFTTQTALLISASAIDRSTLRSFDDTEALLEWSKIESLLSSIYASQMGRPSYLQLTLFRSLLLGMWYRLSVAQLAHCLYRDLLFRKFCHLELSGDLPGASTIGRFRTRLVERIYGVGYWEGLTASLKRRTSS